MPRNTIVFYSLCVIWWICAAYIHITYTPEIILQTINGQHTPQLDTLMTIITRVGEGWVIAPVLIVSLILWRGARFNGYFIAAIIVAILAPTIVTNLLKTYFNAPRPLTVYAQETWMYLIPQYENSYMRSFPSGHTTGAFACMTICTYISQHRSRVLPILLFALALLAGISRMYLLQHFWEDVLWGSIIGVTVSSAVLYIYTRIVTHRGR